MSVLILLSCKNEKKAVSTVKENELQTYVTETIKKIDSTISLDTFRYVYLDTITEKEKLSEIVGSITDEMKVLNERTGNELELMKTNAKLVRLADGLSSTLFDTYKSDLNDNKKEIDKNTVLFQKLQLASDSIITLAKSADSIKPVAYYAACFYQIRHKDQSVKRDTFFVLLNNNLNIVKRSDFFNFKPYVKDYE